MRSPKEIVSYVTQVALAKARLDFSRLFVLSILAGVYISMGGLLALLLGYGFPGMAMNNPGLQKLLFGGAFPLGLMLIVLAGGELFTGNCAYFIPNIMSGRQGYRVALRNWGVVWIGNFIGAFVFAYFFVYSVGVVHASPWIDGVKAVGMAKVSHSFYVTFLKGIGANWLVCLAMWLGMSSKTTVGKIIGIWVPVMAFVSMGYEHSIANMFFIPLAILEGSEITIGDLFLNNLLPTTLGNIVGGSFFVGFLYWYVYDKIVDCGMKKEGLNKL